MSALQLEFNLDNTSPEEMQMTSMQKQIEEISISMDKVRKRLFAELSEVKKLYADLKKEHDDMKALFKEVKTDDPEWVYKQGNSLFMSI